LADSRPLTDSRSLAKSWSRADTGSTCSGPRSAGQLADAGARPNRWSRAGC
jgi:hypothetical protein